MNGREVIEILSSSPEVDVPKIAQRAPQSSTLANAATKLVEVTNPTNATNLKRKIANDWFHLSDDEELPPPTEPILQIPSTKPSREVAERVDDNEPSSDGFWSSIGMTADLPADPIADAYPSQEQAPLAKKRRLFPTPGLRAASDRGLILPNVNGGTKFLSDTVSKSRTSASSGSKLLVAQSIIVEDDVDFQSSPPEATFRSKPNSTKLIARRQYDLPGDAIQFTSSAEIPLANDEKDSGHALPLTKPEYKTSHSSINFIPIDDESSSDLDLPDIGTLASEISKSDRPKTSRKISDQALAKYNLTKTNDRNVDAKRLKAQDKERKAEEKLRVKELEKERKRLAREDKAAEKEMALGLAKVNQKRTEKKVSTPEMIVDLPMGLDKHITIQITKGIEELGAECQEGNATLPNVIRWRRKISAVYNEELEHWQPAPEHIKREMQVLCYMKAAEFVQLACAGEEEDLESHFLRMQTRFPGCSIIYLIEGLINWQKKNQNVKNRQFTEAVRSQMVREGSAAAASSSQRSKKKQPMEYIDDDAIEDALLNLQVIHRVLIHHTSCPAETVQWVIIFTQHISTAPYRQQQMKLDTTFCMDSGQVKTGEDAEDTFIKMLQEVTRITAPIAYGIAAKYPSAQKLVSGFENHGKLILQNLKKTANRDGALTDRDIGGRISQRLYNIFTGRDETTMDV